MGTTVNKIYDEAKCHPQEEPHPGWPGQRNHQVNAYKHTRHGGNAIERDFEFSWNIRLCTAEDEYSNGYQHKSEKGTNVGKLCSNININCCGKQSNNTSHDQCPPYRSLKSFMNFM